MKQLKITESRIAHYNKLIDEATEEILIYLDEVEQTSFELNMYEGMI